MPSKSTEGHPAGRMLEVEVLMSCGRAASRLEGGCECRSGRCACLVGPCVCEGGVCVSVKRKPFSCVSGLLPPRLVVCVACWCVAGAALCSVFRALAVLLVAL
jgi:hypothetical protein